MRDAVMTRSLASSKPMWRWQDLITLGKPRVVLVMLVCVAVGMALAVPSLPPLSLVVHGLVGIGLAASGAAAFNHVLDRRLDRSVLQLSSPYESMERIGPDRSTALRCAITSSMIPYSLASAAVSTKSRSVSVLIFSLVCPV